MASQFDLVWGDEKPGAAEALAKAFPDLRSKRQDGRVRALKIMLRNPGNVDLALALIADDPSKLPAAQHIHTDILYSLGCINMIRARHKQSEHLDKSGKEESEAIQIVVDKQLSEMRLQMAHSLKTQDHLQMKIDGLTGAIADIGHKADTRYTESSTNLHTLSDLVTQLIKAVASWAPTLTSTKSTVTEIKTNLLSLVRQMGGIVATENVATFRPPRFTG
jgi:hypothetical protein